MEKLDARVDVGLYGHAKIKKLIRRVGFEAPWRLVGLWLYARQHKPDGVLSGMTAEDIELAVDWTGKTGELVAALVECRWLDLSDDTYKLHDWEEHQPFASNAQARKDSARLAGLIRQYGERKGREMFHAYQARQGRDATGPLAESERPASDPLADRTAHSFLPSLPSKPEETDRPRKRGSRLPKPFEIPPEWVREGGRIEMEMGAPLAVKMETEFAKFCDHWWGKSGKDAAKDDWLATWRNWIRRACEYAPKGQAAPKPKQACAKCERPATGWDGAHYCESHLPIRNAAVLSLGAALKGRVS